jgi:translation initiation factor 2 alpha subunit (eIF-2alpha)
MPDFPETGEFVIGTVKKIMPYGAFCTLDEYGGLDSFLHVSQVSSGWIRNIREHLREGQKVVAKVITLDREKGQVDLSIKQVTEADRKRKLTSFQAEKKARKLIEWRASSSSARPRRRGRSSARRCLKSSAACLTALLQLPLERPRRICPRNGRKRFAR